MDWRDQFKVEDEKVDVRWLLLACTIALLAVAGYYFLHDGRIHVLSNLVRESNPAIVSGA